jgi:hypothetical protein
MKAKALEMLIKKHNYTILQMDIEKLDYKVLSATKYF